MSALRLVCAAVVVVACSSSPKPAPTAPAAEVERKCADGTPCAEPGECIANGHAAEKPAYACYVTCADKECPNGLHCLDVIDGPGKVCLPAD